MQLAIEDVVDIAMDFVRKAGFAFARVTSTTPEMGHWVVLVDVSVYGPKEIKKIYVDDATGKITKFE